MSAYARIWSLIAILAYAFILSSCFRPAGAASDTPPITAEERARTERVRRLMARCKSAILDCESKRKSDALQCKVNAQKSKSICDTLLRQCNAKLKSCLQRRCTSCTMPAIKGAVLGSAATIIVVAIILVVVNFTKIEKSEK